MLLLLSATVTVLCRSSGVDVMYNHRPRPPPPLARVAFVLFTRIRFRWFSYAARRASKADPRCVVAVLVVGVKFKPPVVPQRDITSRFTTRDVSDPIAVHSSNWFTMDMYNGVVGYLVWLLGYLAGLPVGSPQSKSMVAGKAILDTWQAHTRPETLLIRVELSICNQCDLLTEWGHC